MLEINPTKEVKDLHNQNFKSQRNQLKKTLHVAKISHNPPATRKKILKGIGGKRYGRKKAEVVSGASNRKPSVREKDKF